MSVKWASVVLVMMALMVSDAAAQQGGSERLREIEEGLAEFQELVEDKE